MSTTKSIPYLNSKIKFLGLVNENGRLVNSIKNKNFILSDKTSEILFMSIRLQNSLQNDFIEQFGKAFKIIIEYENSDLFLCPLDTFVIVAITQKNLETSKLKTTIMSNLNFLMYTAKN